MCSYPLFFTVITLVWAGIFQEYQLASKFHRKLGRSLCLGFFFHGASKGCIFLAAWCAKSVTEFILDPMWFKTSFRTQGLLCGVCFSFESGLSLWVIAPARTCVRSVDRPDLDDAASCISCWSFSLLPLILSIPPSPGPSRSPDPSLSDSW